MSLQHETLCVGNIDHSLKKEDLEHLLYELFIPYGQILSMKIVRKQAVTKNRGRDRTGKLYDQPMAYMKTIAFISFHSENQAVAAKKALHNFKFFNRGILVDFSRTRADVVAYDKDRLTYTKGEQALAEKKEMNVTIKKAEISKEPTLLDINATNTLVCNNLSSVFTEEIMRPLFKQFPGLRKISVIEGLLRVDFENKFNASKCISELQGFKVDKNTSMNLMFEKS